LFNPVSIVFDALGVLVVVLVSGFAAVVLVVVLVVAEFDGSMFAEFDGSKKSDTLEKFFVIPLYSDCAPIVPSVSIFKKLLPPFLP
jgi:hypothetical protein